MRQRYGEIKSYITKDGSEIRELMHPDVQGNRAQSLAEATVPRGVRTHLHRHAITEEIYHVTSGQGCMTLGDESFVIEVGETVCIAPGIAHCVEALGDEPLKLLCCCSPAYSHQDTEILAKDTFADQRFPR